MPTKVLTDARIYAHGLDLSGDSNQVAVTVNPAEVAKTTFGNTGKRRAAGLSDGGLDVSGLIDYADANENEAYIIANLLGADNLPYAVADPATHGALTEGDPATFGQGVLLDFTPFQAPVGEMMSFDASVMWSKFVIPGGVVLHGATRTGNGNGGAVTLTPFSASATFYAALFVVAASGTSPTLDVTIESDADSGFGTPTTQHTFAQFTGRGSEWATPFQPGDVAEDTWRVTWSIGGTSPSFTFIVVIGQRNT